MTVILQCVVFFLEFIIFNPSIIFGTNKLPLFHIEMSSLMLHVSWQNRRCRYGCWIYLPYICWFFPFSGLWKHVIDQKEWSPLIQRVYLQTVSWVIREESFMALIVAEQQQKSYKQAPRRASSVVFFLIHFFSLSKAFPSCLGDITFSHERASIISLKFLSAIR